MKRRWIRFPLLLIAAALAAGALVFAARQPLLRAAGGWLDVGQQPTSVDYVLPLAGDFNSRPFVAAEIYRAGLAKKVLLPQPGRSAEVENGAALAHEEICRLVVLKLGVPERDIIMLEGQNHTTFDEANRLRQFVASHGPCSVAVVTSDFHTRRSLWIFRHVLGDAPCALRVMSAPVLDYSARNWWQSADGMTAYVCEFAKLAFYYCYYGSGLLWAAVGLAVAAGGCWAWWARSARSMLAHARSPACAR